MSPDEAWIYTQDIKVGTKFVERNRTYTATSNAELISLPGATDRYRVHATGPDGRSTKFQYYGGQRVLRDGWYVEEGERPASAVVRRRISLQHGGPHDRPGRAQLLGPVPEVLGYKPNVYCRTCGNVFYWTGLGTDAELPECPISLDGPEGHGPLKPIGGER